MQRTQQESLGLYHGIRSPTRRVVEFNAIIGVPSMASHLPEAEAILPGHTLIKPALGMLKSSIKFPHKDRDDGAGVYGNYNNLGIPYNSKSTRVLYSGFRRALSDYLMVAPVNTNTRNPKLLVTSVVLDLDKEKDANNKILSLYEMLKRRNGKKRRKKKLKQFKKPLELNMLFPTDSSSSESTRRPKIALRQRLRSVKPKTIFKEKSKRINRNDVLRTKVERQEEEEELEPVYPDTEGSGSDGQFFNDKPPQPVSEERPANLTKMELLLQSKNWFNHIKISPEAPYHEDLIPKYNISDSYMSNNIRNWWFYHQDDLQSAEAPG